MSVIKLKLYKEKHGDGNLLPAIRTVFAEAQAAGCKTCFVEFPLDKQDYYDSTITGIAAKAFDREATLHRLIKEHDAGDGLQRQFKTEHFLIVLSAMTGVRLVCADRGERQPIIEIRYRFMQLMRDRVKAEAVLGDFAWAAEVLNCPVDQVGGILQQFQQELTGGTFKKNLQNELAARFADDPKVAAFMASYMMTNRTPAIAFWGRTHADLERPASLTNSLVESLGAAVELFHIVDGKIIQIAVPERGNATPPLKAQSCVA